MKRWPAWVISALLVAAGACSADPAPTAATTTTTTVSTTTTTTVVATTAAPVAPLAGKVVVIDPGHNEHNAQHPTEINQEVDVVTQRKACDTTGTATDSGYSEAAFTADVADRLAALLRTAGATVVLTRGPDTPWGPCITE